MHLGQGHVLHFFFARQAVLLAERFPLPLLNHEDCAELLPAPEGLEFWGMALESTEQDKDGVHTKAYLFQAQVFYHNIAVNLYCTGSVDGEEVALRADSNSKYDDFLMIQSLSDSKSALLAHLSPLLFTLKVTINLELRLLALFAVDRYQSLLPNVWDCWESEWQLFVEAPPRDLVSSRLFEYGIWRLRMLKKELLTDNAGFWPWDYAKELYTHARLPLTVRECRWVEDIYSHQNQTAANQLDSPLQEGSYMSRFMREAEELAGVLQQTWPADLEPLTYYPVDGNLIAFYRYGHLVGDLGDMEYDVVDFDGEYAVEVRDLEHFFRFGVELSRRLEAQQWEPCILWREWPPSQYVFFKCGLFDIFCLLRTPDGHGLRSLGPHTSHPAWNGTMPLSVVRPLGRCRIGELSAPCPSDISSFLRFWNGGEYEVDNWCLALPMWTSQERGHQELARWSEWMHSGFSAAKLRISQEIWQKLTNRGFLSMASVWSQSQACHRARDKIEKFGNWQGVTTEAAPDGVPTGFAGGTLRYMIRPENEAFHYFLNQFHKDRTYFVTEYLPLTVRQIQNKRNDLGLKCCTGPPDDKEGYPARSVRLLLVVGGVGPLVDPHLSWLGHLPPEYSKMDSANQIVDYFSTLQIFTNYRTKGSILWCRGFDRMVALARVDLLAFLFTQFPPHALQERKEVLTEILKEVQIDGQAAPLCQSILQELEDRASFCWNLLMENPQFQSKPCPSVALKLLLEIETPHRTSFFRTTDQRAGASLELASCLTANGWPFDIPISYDIEHHNTFDILAARAAIQQT